MNNPPPPREIEELDRLIEYHAANIAVAVKDGLSTVRVLHEARKTALEWERRCALAEAELAAAKIEVEVAEEERDNEADRASDADENSRFWVNCATDAINAVTPILLALDMEPEIAGLTRQDDDWGSEYEDAVGMMERAPRKIEELKAELAKVEARHSAASARIAELESIIDDIPENQA